ncbi:MAG: hypothetical protein DRJ31_03700 [Candidatus Methanomethylicota archaeon]|uniref:DNA primase n=1 Tax=Thermoproteota archaeon TaxID=2056631 RepID=A0A497EQZ2_9CREN|nr:MAG: hypothetical protein DRJ31_03700 [Candidatus Verstraetearchaeota archaeon]
MLPHEEIYRHYARADVRREIVKFAANRWLGVLCLKRDNKGKPLFKRYIDGKPLKAFCEEDFSKLLEQLSRIKPRSFYASANVYASLDKVEDLTLENVIACTPTWDIDNTLDKWRATMEVVKEIVSFLESKGVKKSVYVKWSGEGCHVHLHEKAISPELRTRKNPMDLAFAIVEYVNAKLSEKIHEIAAKYSADELKVENKIDPQRLFTCPLSLHKELDKVCVCIELNKLDSFTPEDANVKGFKHFDKWHESYVEGEADGLAEEAYETIGPYPLRTLHRRRKTKPLDLQIMQWRALLEKEFGGSR